MNYCKMCGAILLDSHYNVHDLTKEQYEEKYGTDKYNGHTKFGQFHLPPKREISELEKRDASRKFASRQV